MLPPPLIVCTKYKNYHVLLCRGLPLRWHEHAPSPPPNKLTGQYSSDDVDHFKCNFGVDPLIASIACDLMREHTDMPDNIKIHHTLWGLALLKIYDMEKVICDHVGARDEKNFRKWSWGSVGWLANLEPYVVSQNPTERFDCLTDFYID